MVGLSAELLRHFDLARQAWSEGRGVWITLTGLSPAGESEVQANLAASTVAWGAHRLFEAADEDYRAPIGPFWSLLQQVLAASHRDPEEILEQAGLRFRLRTRLCQRLTGKTLSAIEDVIPEEIPFERTRLAASWRTLLRATLEAGPLVLVLPGAERLGPEALDLVADEALWANYPVLGVLIFRKGNPAENRWPTWVETYLRQSLARGQAWDFGQQDTRSIAALRVADRELLLEFHAERLLLHLMPPPGPSSGEERRLWYTHLAQALEITEDYSQAVEVLESALAVADPPPSPSCQHFLAVLGLRLYRIRGDWANVIRLAGQAWALQKGAWATPIDRLRLDYEFLSLPEDRTRLPEAMSNLNARLRSGLEAAGWQYHLAGLLTRNTTIVSEGRLVGYAAALRQVRAGLDLASRLGNLRRMAVGHQSLASIHQRLGRVRQAQFHFREASRLMKIAGRPFEWCQATNGLGYFHFTIGAYRRSWKAHHQALVLLWTGTHFEETLITLANLARVYWLHGQPAVAVNLYSQLMEYLDQLNLHSLPFHHRIALWSLMGAAAIEAEDLFRAEELARRVCEADLPGGDIYLADFYKAYFLARLRLVRADREGSLDHLHYLEDGLTELDRESPPFSLRVRMLRIDYELACGRITEAEEARLACLARLKTPGRFDYERRLLEAQPQGQVRHHTRPLPTPDWDPRILTQLIQQEVNLQRLQQKMREGQFLVQWQQFLVRYLSHQDLIATAESQLRDYLNLDHVWILPTEDEVAWPAAAQSLGLRSWMAEWKEQPRFLTGSAAPQGVSSVAYFPLVYAERFRFALVVVTTDKQQTLRPEDQATLVLAQSQLTTTLLARLRSHEVERRQAALEKANKKLTRALKRLRQTRDQLVQSEKMAALGGLVAGVAHEINTPLGVALTAASHMGGLDQGLTRAMVGNQLRRTDLDRYLTDAGEAHVLIEANLNRAVDLVQSFKLVAVDQSSQDRRTFHLGSYVVEVLRSLQPQWKHTPYQVEVEPGPDPELESYPGALAQVLTNLVSNALLHAFEGRDSGTIRLRWAEDGRQVRLEVEDNGRGIPETDKHRIFDPFFTTRRGRGGTGLGLHIVFNLVHSRLGGSIQVEAAPGGGTRFRVLFPKVAP